MVGRQKGFGRGSGAVLFEEHSVLTTLIGYNTFFDMAVDIPFCPQFRPRESSTAISRKEGIMEINFFYGWKAFWR